MAPISRHQIRLDLSRHQGLKGASDKFLKLATSLKIEAAGKVFGVKKVSE